MSKWLHPCCSVNYFGNPSCIKFMYVKSVKDDFISRMETDLELVFQFVDSHHSVVENQHAFPSVVDVDGRPDRSSSDTFVWPPLNVSIDSYTRRCDKTLSPHCADSLR